LRDEARIADYLDRRGAEYFVAFPSLYPSLAARSELVFSTGGQVSPTLGGENLSVYRWVSNGAH